MDTKREMIKGDQVRERSNETIGAVKTIAIEDAR